MSDETPADELARLRARVEQLEEELAAARVQMTRDASHMALCTDQRRRARIAENRLTLLEIEVLRLRRQSTGGTPDRRNTDRTENKKP